MSHINNVEVDSKFFRNEIYMKALGTKIINIEKTIKKMIINMNNESIISVLANYENKIEKLEKHNRELEERIITLENKKN